MDWLRPLLDWAGDSANSNLVRTVVALLAVPGALWGAYLFVRWMRGSGIDAQLDTLNRKIDDIIIETPDGERISFPAVEIDAALKAIQRTEYKFLGVQFSLRDVLQDAFSVINNMNWRSGSGGYHAFTEILAWRVMGKLKSVMAASENFRADVITRMRDAQSPEAHTNFVQFGEKRIPVSEEACQVLSQIVADATAMNLINIYQADSQYHSVSVLVPTKFGMAVLKRLALQI
jgi:hypothetical protein